MSGGCGLSLTGGHGQKRKATTQGIDRPELSTRHDTLAARHSKFPGETLAPKARAVRSGGQNVHPPHPGQQPPCRGGEEGQAEACFGGQLSG